MNLMQDVNLIPQEEVLEQSKEKAVKLSTYLSIGLLFITLLLSGVFYYQSYLLKTKLSTTNIDIENLRKKINGLSSVEIKSRNLDKKYTVIKNIMSSTPKYSMLLDEFRIRKPSDLRFDSIDIKNNALTVSGDADSYLSISDFVTNLLSKNYSSGNPLLKDLFTSVSLNTVSIDSSSSRVKFLIVVEYNQEKLR